MDNPGFLDYRIPVALDLPMIEPVMVEVRIPVIRTALKALPKLTFVRRWQPSPTRSSARRAGG
jgi:hypothetical protein